MFKRILVPTDGSELSEKTVRGAVDFARQQGSEVFFVTVVERPYPALAADDADTFMKMLNSDAATRLAQAKSIADAAGVPSHLTSIPAFSPAEAIVDFAGEKDCDLIIMASHGRKGLSALLLGSETQKVLVYSKIPVLVYR